MRPGDGRLTLRPLRPTDESASRRAHAELRGEGFTLLEPVDPGVGWLDYIEWLERMREGRDLPDGWVPFTFLVADVAGDIVGSVSVRHRLDDHLATVGGHIGYAVRPGFRRRGFATEMLRQALGVARTVCITRALLTCDDDNVGSAAVIERCGGVLERVLPATPDRPAKRHYWFEVADTA
jgi:predicted acetyltransferase